MLEIWRSIRGSKTSGNNGAAQRLSSNDDKTLMGATGNEEKVTADGLVQPVETNDIESPPAREATGGNLAKRELTMGGAWEYTGFAFPTWRKWSILTSVFIVQISMNYNASAYANAVSGLTEEYGISSFQARLGEMVFLVAYVSHLMRQALQDTDVMGRLLVARHGLPGQKSLGASEFCKARCSFLVNMFQIPCALSRNWTTVIVARALGGLSSAGGSVTLGIVADMWQPEDQQYATSFVVLSSVAGSLVFWIQLIFGAVTQAIHFFVAKETNTDTLLDRKARKRRCNGTDTNIWGPQEIRGTFWQRISWKHIGTLMWRPYRLLLTEPIVGFLSLLSGFSDALIFTGLSSISLVLKEWDFNIIHIGLYFIGVFIGYIFAYPVYMLHYWRDGKRKAASVKGSSLFTSERRLYLLLFLVLLGPIGLLGFAFISIGSPHGHWITLNLFTIPIGIANLAIYHATIDYMVAAYSPYSASATGGNGFCRDALAGFAALYAVPMYRNIAASTKWLLVVPSLILAGIGAALCVPVFVFYFYGTWFRENSKFAQNIEAERQEDLSVATNFNVNRAREKTFHAEVAAEDPDMHLRRTEVWFMEFETPIWIPRDQD